MTSEDITEVQIKIVAHPLVLAYSRFTLLGAVTVADVKILAGLRGRYLAFPDRRVTEKCEECREPNHLRAAYCNTCGMALGGARTPAPDAAGRLNYFADMIWPVSAQARRLIESVLFAAYDAELGRLEDEAGESVTADAAFASAPLRARVGTGVAR